GGSDTVSHVYTEPGTYSTLLTVSGTLSDGTPCGNSVSGTATVTCPPARSARATCPTSPPQPPPSPPSPPPPPPPSPPPPSPPPPAGQRERQGRVQEAQGGPEERPLEDRQGGDRHRVGLHHRRPPDRHRDRPRADHEARTRRLRRDRRRDKGRRRRRRPLV